MFICNLIHYCSNRKYINIFALDVWNISLVIYFIVLEGSSCSYGGWIINYLCNQYLSPLTLWVRIRVFSTNKSDHKDINEKLLKVALSTITLTLCVYLSNKVYEQWWSTISPRRPPPPPKKKTMTKQTKKLPFTSNNATQKSLHHLSIKIQVLALDRHKNVAVLSQLLRFQLSFSFSFKVALQI